VRDDPVPGAPGPYFLTVGAIDPRKNHLGLLRGFRLARDQGLSLRWKVVGGPRYHGASILRRLHDQPGVELLGAVDDVALEALYRNARFVASPSHVEGFGYPPLEAMTRRIPAICATGSAFDETVGDAALRAPAEDAQAWADALLRLSEDDGEHARLRADGWRRASEFTWERSAARCVAVYEEIAGRPQH
jgi:glycosyltransferase involved in cell wall biosynthesis